MYKGSEASRNTCMSEGEVGPKCTCNAHYLLTPNVDTNLNALKTMKVCFLDISPPCLVLMAVDGTDGKTLWKRPLAPEFDWVECGVKGIGWKGTGCLVAHANNLTAVDKRNGTKCT